MSTYTAIFTAVGALLAIWSLTWIPSAIRSGNGVRNAEVEARARVARGEGWDGEATPRGFSDAELLTLAASQEPLTLEAAGVLARPKPKTKRRSRGRM